MVIFCACNLLEKGRLRTFRFQLNLAHRNFVSDFPGLFEVCTNSGAWVAQFC